LIRGLRTGLSVRISISIARHFLKHPIDCADVEVNGTSSFNNADTV
jgi:hypothetical protein